MTVRQHLARLIEDRANHLGRDLGEVATIGGISSKTLWDVRFSERMPSPKTKRGIEKGLVWPHRILDALVASAEQDFASGKFDYLVTLPRTQAHEQPGQADAMQRTYDRILARRGREVAEQWLADTRELAGDTDSTNPKTQSDTA